jgi:hypothetical protein
MKCESDKFKVNRQHTMPRKETPEAHTDRNHEARPVVSATNISGT